MTRALRILAAVGVSFAGGFFIARLTETDAQCVADTFTETATVIRTIQAEAERSSQATERIIERKIAVPCKCSKLDISKTETPIQTAETQPTGTLVLDERIVERAVGTTEKLKIGAFSDFRSDVSAVQEKPQESQARPPRWRLGVMAGYDWTDAVPIYGLTAGMRLVGPVEVGVWSTVSQRLHGAVGLSVAASW